MSELDAEINGVSLSHPRLVELFRLADAAEPYFLWLQEIAVKKFKSLDLNTFLMDASYSQLITFVKIAQ